MSRPFQMVLDTGAFEGAARDVLFFCFDEIIMSTSTSSSHKTKSKSISALPPQIRARLTPSVEPSITRSRSVRSCKARSTGSSALLSPSRLPSTTSVSYFPPFESMGSRTDSEPEDIPRSSHVKGRSLGSLAGLVSWSLNLASSPSTPSRLDGGSGIRGSSPDGEVVDRLAKRFTPARRRVLETRTVNADMDMWDTEQNESRKEGAQKRRMGSEAEVENMIRRGRREKNKEDDEEGLVERLISDSPSRPPRRKTRPTLTVPLPSFPPWRFPLPSPPVTCLSPDIPLEAFRRHISNPLSRETSPQPEEELDEVDQGLSPSPTSSDSSDRPSTPDDDDDDEGDDGSSDRLRITHSGDDGGRLKLERNDSHLSTDSRETIRVKDPEKRAAVKEGERTPRVGKGWRTVSEVSVVRI
ncbi:hypothetical protein BCR39DRAFT_561103 [Naematelia encephala]|uniref:Uncharacterized protein n=1 Tax=Naematelia encephala TaxID=71784 RepID=A0A1Y2AS08_9TREE|nr:hypothetical protein BCR39DRAFT_561103 [Naematelia encephala]